MKIYIAGPMRGLPGWNFPAFDTAEKKWRGVGHVAFSPAQMDRALGYGPNAGEVDASHLRHVILSDIACLLHADAIALLPEWETSSGATVELALAQFLGLPVFDAETMDRIYPHCKPWQELANVENWMGTVLADVEENPLKGANHASSH